MTLLTNKPDPNLSLAVELNKQSVGRQHVGAHVLSIANLVDQHCESRTWVDVLHDRSEEVLEQ